LLSFAGIRLAQATRPRLNLYWTGVRKPLSYAYFPVWVKGQLLKVPVKRVRRSGARRGAPRRCRRTGTAQTPWTASGELRTKTGSWHVEDVLTPRGNTLVIDREWRYRGGGAGRVRLGMDLAVPFGQLDYWAIPYISMNGNPGSKALPTGLAREHKPRSTDLSATTTENDGAGVADLLLALYQATGTKRYLQAAVRAAEYCLAFLFTYNVHFPPQTDCGRRRMRTRGCAAISPETGFVCPWFALQANVFLELWRQTGQRRWRQYAAAVIRGSLQMITRRGDTFGLAGRLVGCRGEVVPVVDTVKGPHVCKKGMVGCAMHEPVWWPAAFNLLNFALIEDRFPQVLRESVRLRFEEIEQ